jgi:hypothetical protein
LREIHNSSRKIKRSKNFLAEIDFLLYFNGRAFWFQQARILISRDTHFDFNTHAFCDAHSAMQECHQSRYILNMYDGACPTNMQQTHF